MQRTKINATNAAPAAASGYSNAVEIADFKRVVFISGQIPADRDGRVPSGFAAQCRQVWANIEAQLHAAGMTLDNIVKLTTFLADRAYGAENRTIRREILGDLHPASTMIIATLLDPAWLLEVEVIAAR